MNISYAVKIYHRYSIVYSKDFVIFEGPYTFLSVKNYYSILTSIY